MRQSAWVKRKVVARGGVKGGVTVWGLGKREKGGEAPQDEPVRNDGEREAQPSVVGVGVAGFGLSGRLPVSLDSFLFPLLLFSPSSKTTRDCW